MSLELIGAATKLCMKILNLSSEPFCGHGIGASDDGDQVHVPAEMSTVKNHVFSLPVIHHSWLLCPLDFLF